MTELLRYLSTNFHTPAPMSRIVSISEAASIALHSMVLIARSEHSVNVNTIAQVTGASRHHVAKVLQRLVKNGYLSSLRGPNGGFRLLKNPDQITLLEVYECIEGKIVIHKCLMENQVCPFDKCLMSNIIFDLNSTFRHYLHSQPLGKFI